MIQQNYFQICIQQNFRSDIPQQNRSFGYVTIINKKILIHKEN